MSKRQKILLIAIDFAVVLLAFFFAVFIRFEGEVTDRYFIGFEWLFAVNALICVLTFNFFGLYRKLWRYAGIQELKNIFWANIIAFSPALMAALLTGGRYYSRSIIIIAGLLTFFLTGGIRFLLRIVNEGLGRTCAGKRTLIVGADDAGEAVLRDLLRRCESGYSPLGFVDDDPSKTNFRIHNVPVLGAVRDIPRIVRERDIEEILIALPSPSLISKVIQECKNLKVDFKVVPPLSELITGRMLANQIRKVEIQDLMEREVICLDMERVSKFLTGKRVLVTGAGGSIGSEICRQTLSHPVEQLILLGRGENSIYEIALELGRTPSAPLAEVIGDIKDKARMRGVFEKYRPHVIFHAAAHKHVPLMEKNISEAVNNNVFGTRNLMELAEEFGAESFILLSTDKAVNPSSIMGATKRLAEMEMKAFCREGHKCRFAAVRFGNVLDSRGSVIPTFRRQIAMGGPVTLTHPDMTRFFMTIPEAVQLVIQTASLAGDGEIFILDMGKPMKIMDLARNMIRLSGFEPDVDIPIEIKGSRPGEKLEEELINMGEQTGDTEIAKILKVITVPGNLDELGKKLNKLERISTSGNETDIKQILKEIIPNFHPLEP